MRRDRFANQCRGRPVCLVITRILARGCGRQHRAWGGALAEPQEYGVSKHQARGWGRQLFVIRYFVIIEIESMAVARIRGLAR